MTTVFCLFLSNLGESLAGSTGLHRMSLRGGGWDLPGGLKYLADDDHWKEAVGPRSSRPGEDGAGFQDVPTATAKSILVSETDFDLFKDEDVNLANGIQTDGGIPAGSANGEKNPSQTGVADIGGMEGYRIRNEAVMEELEAVGYLEEMLEDQGIEVERDSKGGIWHHYDLSHESANGQGHATAGSSEFGRKRNQREADTDAPGAHEGPMKRSKKRDVSHRLGGDSTPVG
eukprot:CAMPEP_0202824792 /NCGR_PEP_ID=MMETSP1389-20130828/12592_1 /ASSEMBLY_ACC=CAM_ASM_000865 /TAXON_ID=302021 /ORGANISM="Rhodomonas sp., Strain CCMP768" /LENGTH=229 /DNA_ID=CAMNT_0049497937 /DNA_START=16 /DNA_END=705 /DNA_ORIENTATION=+